ncbi:MAG: hypothetical protein WA156_07475 [Methylocystis silviterrae]
MDSYTFASEIVVPTVKEALADRRNRRRTYVAAIVTYSLAEYVAKDAGIDRTDVYAALRGVCELAFEVVQGICNGTKHAGNSRGFRFVPGQDRHVPVFAWGVSSAGWGQGRWGVSGLSVERNGEELFLDTCIQVVLLSFCRIYKDQLGKLDLSFLDQMLLQGQSTD